MDDKSEVPDYNSEQYQYGLRLLHRVVNVAYDGTPADLALASDNSFWQELEPATSILRSAMVAYSHGKISKSELDEKAAMYLQWWRDLVHEHQQRQGL